MGPAGRALLTEGTAALGRGDWAGARQAFGSVLDRDESPEACHGLARAQEWAGDFEAAVRSYERAYAGYRARGETRLPALIAGRELSFLHAAVYGNGAAAGGWLARARRLADEAGECPETGWVELAEALAAADAAEMAAHAAAAARIADRCGDPDLRFCALAYEGTSRVLRGRVDHGMRQVDEAAVAATSGEVRDHLVVGEIFCKMLLCCELVLDVRRAQQWLTVADAVGRASHDLWVSGICRMHYGGILISAGRWPEAEDQLATSLRIHDTGMRALRTGAAVRLADLRLRQGRVDEAAVLLDGAEGDSAAVLPQARLHLVRDEPEAAVAVLRHALPDPVRAEVVAAPALALLAELLVEQDDRAGADPPAGRLRELASATGLPQVRGLAEQAAGALLRSVDRSAVLGHLQAARLAFAEAGLCWEAARARLLVAGELAGTRPGAAAAEARVALIDLRTLGAGRDADRAARLLRSLGSATGPAPRVPGPLTQREREVLGLMVEGLANQQIADRLFLSKRTVEHHVSRVLAALGVRTRAEAMAQATRDRVLER